jgi:putative DNA primase/helicase
MAPKKKISQGLPRCTDMGNAELFADRYRDRLRFDHSRNRWLLWASHWWTEDVDGELMRMAKRAARFRLEQSANFGHDEQHRKQAKWALHSESLPRLEAMLKLAESEKLLADDGCGWDEDPFILGVENGVVDLKTGKLRAGNPSDKVTLHTNVNFNPNATCLRWDRLLLEICDGDSELVSYVHRAVGYSLTGDTSEQCFFCCHGKGGNGKTTFLNAVRCVIGSYACNLPFSALELQARSAIPNDVATLPGRRFVTAIETDEAARLNEARIKALTGGDPITARLLNREYFTSTPVSKFWLAFNHPPVVADDSHGLWRRVRQIPFVRQFDLETEPGLENVLRGEAPGILAWAVRGCLEWQTMGLDSPSVVQEATEAYREASDPVRDFVADRCILDPGAQVVVAVLWEDYRNWCLQNGEQHCLERPAFTRRLEALGLRKTRYGHDRDWIWLGVCRRQDAEVQCPPADADVRADADVKLQ